MPLPEDLKNGPFRNQALIPHSPWLDAVAPASPSAKVLKAGDLITVNITPPAGEPAFVYVVYSERDGDWDYDIVSAKEAMLTLQSGGTRTVTRTSNQGLDVETEEVAVEKISRIAVSAVDRFGNESNRVILPVN